MKQFKELPAAKPKQQDSVAIYLSEVEKAEKAKEKEGDDIQAEYERSVKEAYRNHEFDDAAASAFEK